MGRGMGGLQPLELWSRGCCGHTGSRGCCGCMAIRGLCGRVGAWPWCMLIAPLVIDARRLSAAGVSSRQLQLPRLGNPDRKKGRVCSPSLVSPDNPGFAQNAPRVRLRSAFSIQNHSPFRTRDGSKNPGEGIRNRAYISSLATQIYPKSWFRNSSVRFWMDPRKCLVRLLI